MFAGIITNQRRPLSPPTEKVIYHGIPEIEQAVHNMTACTFMGDSKVLNQELSEFIDRYDIDEIMTTNYIFDNQKRLESFKILKKALHD